MPPEIKSNQKGVVAAATGFEGVAGISKLGDRNIFDKSALRALNRGGVVRFNK